MVQFAGLWKPEKELPTQSKSYEHDWKESTVINYTICYYCGILTTDMSRLNCPKCQLTACALCVRNYLGKIVNVKGKKPHKLEEEKDFGTNEVKLLKELLKEKTEQNDKLCKLDIINPDITIEDRPLKHVTLTIEDSFKKHVDSLLEIGAIRLSKSRHRTMAMIVNSRTTIDPTTGREIKGKERMVLNYKSLNDNIYKDQYSLPGINTIIKRVGGAKIFSKFDLKSRFHQEHDKHLEKMLKICKDNGLVLSLIKMKITVPTIDFLGAVIGEGTIKLQPHIIKKILYFNEEQLKTKKVLWSFLRILNYDQNHIPKLGILLRPLYEKTNAHGDKRLKPSNYELVKKIKEQVQSFSDLEIPLENAYIILETDGCMEGWGGIVKWKKSKGDPRKYTGEMKQLAAAALL
uniref:ORFIII-like polyprotein n=1 Tax=Tanacetum cinerariifolium TaxID=118510 RepID=A0A699J2G2_TANCI|nr:ORFIII-like polyprotein [Tanacetum cinerariifolium]